MGEFIRINTGETNKFGINNTKPKDIYIEFVPGVVLDVVLNEESPAYAGDDRNINSIEIDSSCNINEEEEEHRKDLDLFIRAKNKKGEVLLDIFYDEYING